MYKNISSFFSGKICSIFFVVFGVFFLSFVAMPTVQTTVFSDVSVVVLADQTADATANTNPPAGANSSAAPATGETAVTAAGTEKTSQSATQKKDAADGNTPDDGQSVKGKISDFASIMVSFFVPLVAMLAKLIGFLLGNEFVMGSMGADSSENITPIAQVLYEVWIVFRDIMNYLFIFILMIIGLMNIIPGKSESFEMKGMIKNLVIAIVAINFTWFGAKLILDAADVATHAVFALPKSVIGKQIKFNNENKDGKPRVCDFKEGTKIPGQIPELAKEAMCMPVHIKINDPKEENPLPLGLAEGKVPENLTNQIKNIENPKIVNYGQITIVWANFDYEKFNAGTIAPLYAFSLMQVQTLPTIANKEGAFSEVGWSELFINAMMALIMMVLIVIVFVVMLIVLFFRIIFIWINIMISPFLGLLMFKDQFGFVSSLENDEKGIGIKSFIQQAFAPAMIGLPLVIGFIIISIGQKNNYTISGNVGNITMDISERTLINGVHDIHQLFFYFLAIMIMWMSVEIGASISKSVAKTAVDAVSSGAESMGKYIASAPMYAQFIPVKQMGGAGEADNISLKTLMSLPEQISSGRTNTQSEDMQKFLGQDSRAMNITNTFNNAPTVKAIIDEKFGDKTTAAAALEKLKLINSKAEYERWHTDNFEGDPRAAQLKTDSALITGMIDVLGAKADISQNERGTSYQLVKDKVSIFATAPAPAPAHAEDGTRQAV